MKSVPDGTANADHEESGSAKATPDTVIVVRVISCLVVSWPPLVF